MIGQHDLQSRITQLIENGTFPRFSILVGPRGSGKKTFAEEIVKYFKAHSVMCPDVKIDTIREIILQAYKTVSTVIYIIPDADNMSTAAKNALLKVTEEPPNNAYFIMTLEDENNILETIRSRGTVFYMDTYTPDEIVDYCGDNYFNADDDNYKKKENIIRELCETPGDVEVLWNSHPLEFYDYVQLVVDNITEVSLANAFKIPSKVALKDDSEGYDLRLFWKAFMKACLQDAVVYGSKAVAVQVTSKYLQKLKVKGINKQMLIDMWLMEIREYLT